MQNRIKYHGLFFNLHRLAALLAALFLGVTVGRADPEATASPVTPTATVSSTYRLSPYDVIDISIYNEEDLHTRAKLGSDGTVLLPLIGSVSLGGKTVAEATELIQKRYANGFVKDPHVLVTVIEYRKSTFSILGQVMRPGIYEIPEGTHMSIVDAVLLAGGFTRTAAQNGVKVKRMVNGKAVVYKVKAGSMADSPDIAPFEIEPGDIIKVNESWF
ncbi:MAG TPA: polysaccharide biosynthesis/export family protein [Candidatus Methylacidiphilales bacterium]|jgi:polysaccharide export outer membrane protein|nr:polysaccharide biosynthesis/export family protein [Candidatus Methylacidiphilales bacterium]